MASSAAFELVLQLKNEASAGLRNVKGDVDNLDRSLDKAGHSSTGFFGGLQGGVGKVAALATGIGAAVVAGGAFIDFLGNATRAAAEEEAGILRLNTALTNNVEGWQGNIAVLDPYIQKMEGLAFADDKVRDSLGSLVARTHDLTQAQQLQSLAADFARGRNIDLSTATEIVGKVYSGNIGILSRYGVAVQEGATATEALGQLQKTFAGQAEAYGNSTQGAMDKMKNAFDNAMETLGSAVLPILADFAELVADLLPKIMDVVTAITDFLKPAFDLIGGILGGIGSAIDDAGQALGLWSEDAEQAAADTEVAFSGMAEGVTGTLDEMTENTGISWDKYLKQLEGATAGTDQATQDIISYFNTVPPALEQAGTEGAEGFSSALNGGIQLRVPEFEQTAAYACSAFDVGDRLAQLGADGATSFAGSAIGTINLNVPNFAGAAGAAVQAMDRRADAAAMGAAIGKSFADSLLATLSVAFGRIKGALAPLVGLLPGIEDLLGAANVGSQMMAGVALQKRVAGGVDTHAGIEAIKNSVDRELTIRGIPAFVEPDSGGGGGGGGGGGKGGGGKSAKEAAEEAKGTVDDAIKSAEEMVGKLDALAKVANFTIPATFQQGAEQFAQAVQIVTGLLAGVASKFKEEALLHLGVFADAAGKGMDLVSKGVDAFTKLKDFTKPTDDAVNAFVDSLAYTIGKLGDVASKWAVESLAILGYFAENTGKAMDMVSTAIDSLMKLHDFKKPTDDAMRSFVDALDYLTDLLRRVIAKWSTEALEQAAVFGENTGKFVDGIGKGIDTLKALGDFKKPADDAVSGFVDSLDYLISLLNSRIANWWGHVNETTAAIATAAGDMASGIAGAIGPLMELGEFKRPATQAVDDFFGALDDFLAAFDKKAAEFHAEAGQLAAELAGRIGALVGGIGAAIAPLASLADFKRPTAEAIDAFFAGLADFLREFDRRAADFQAQAGVLAAELATRIGTVAEGIGRAFDPILRMGEVQAIDRGQIEGAMANLHFALYQLDIVIKGLPANFAEQASEFASKVGGIFGSLAEAMGIVASVENPEGLAGAMVTTVEKAREMVAYFNNEVMAALALLKTNAEVARDGWNSAMESMARAAEDFATRAIAALNSIPGTNAPLGTPTTTIPILDSGGIVTRPTLAALAMNGQPEAVIPWDRMGNLGTRGAGVTINVTVAAPLLATSEQQAAKHIARILYDELQGRI